MINSDTISTASRVLDCCNGYYGYMKPVYSCLPPVWGMYNITQQFTCLCTRMNSFYGLGTSKID